MHLKHFEIFEMQTKWTLKKKNSLHIQLNAV